MRPLSSISSARGASSCQKVVKRRSRSWPYSPSSTYALSSSAIRIRLLALPFDSVLTTRTRPTSPV
jgi:hypothetical protein